MKVDDVVRNVGMKLVIFIDFIIHCDSRDIVSINERIRCRVSTLFEKKKATFFV